jgi:hypothetical protein
VPPRTLIIRAAAFTAGGALLAWAMIAAGFLNYDTAYSLVWGVDLAHGRLPDYDVPVSPTPHPLATFTGLVLAPLGQGAEPAWVVLAFLALGALAWVTYELGALWFGPAAGVLAAVLIITRQPVLSFGVRAYLDLPYLVLVLGALLVEARREAKPVTSGEAARQGAGMPVLVLLGLAGLLRPEAWLFAGAYALWLREARYLLAAAAAPAIWLLADLVVTGDPLFSLTDTQAAADLLQRRTGLDEVPLTVPRRIGEIAREPVLFGAAVGGGLALAWRREAIRLPLIAGAAALAAFCVLAASGLPILGRYLLLPATLLVIVCAGGALGWLALERGEHRRWWTLAGAAVLLALVVFTPAQVDRIADLRRSMGTQDEIIADLRDISEAPAFDGGCRPVAVPNHRPIPHLAFWTGIPPMDIVSAQLERPRRGLYLDPASPRVERNFTLDPNDPRRLTAEVPPGFERVTANASWVLYERC